MYILFWFDMFRLQLFFFGFFVLQPFFRPATFFFWFLTLTCFPTQKSGMGSPPGKSEGCVGCGTCFVMYILF
jgi:hypothetical protein